MCLRQKIKYLYWKIRKVTCEDCGWYFSGDEELNPDCPFYGSFSDLDICHSSFKPKDKASKSEG